MPSRVQIAHLCFKEPGQIGSVNNVVQWQVESLSEFQHVYLHSKIRTLFGKSDNTFLIRAKGWLAAVFLGLAPDRVSSRIFSVQDSAQATWLLRTRELLKELQPPVIVAHDHYKLGRWLRSFVNWPCRVVLTQHGYAYFASEQDLYNLSWYDAVVFLTRASYEYNRLHRHAMECAAEIIPNPIDTEKYRPSTLQDKLRARSEFGLPESAIVVTTVARQVPKKGVHIVLEAWHEIARRWPEAVLWVVGPVPSIYERRLHKIVQAGTGGGVVRFEGAVAAEEIPLVLAASDLFLFPSLCREGMGLTLYEALSSGILCVASKYPELEEGVGEMPVEWVDIPNSPRYWAEAIGRAIQRLPHGDDVRWMQWQFVKRCYGKDVILDRWRQFYRAQIELVRGGVPHA